MNVGEKIKENRIKHGLTQKDLADQLNVTYQAVSRWEKDEVEPSFDTLKKLSSIFGCSIDDLFGIEREEKKEEKPAERIVVQQELPVLAICEKCNRPIRKSEDIHRFNTIQRSGRSSQTIQHLYCTECNEKRNKEIKATEKTKREAAARKVRKHRLQSFIWPSIIAALFFAVGIYMFTSELENSLDIGLLYIGLGVLAYTFSACLILRNNFIGDMWMEIASWGFVSMPGVIFEFSLDGCIAGIVLKLALVAFGFLLAIATIMLATILGFALSIFVYPFALAKSFRLSKPENQTVTVEGVL